MTQVKEAGKFTYREMLERMGRMTCPACPTCNREFLARAEAEELKRDLEAMIQDIPRKVKSLEDRVSQILHSQVLVWCFTSKLARKCHASLLPFSKPMSVVLRKLEVFQTNLIYLVIPTQELK